MLIVFYGLLIGIFISIMGGGGAALYLGVLTSELGMSTAVAAPTSLVVAIPALVFGCAVQMRIHNIHYDLGNRMILASLPGILLGTGVAPFIPAKIYDWVVGTILMVMGAIVVIRSLRHRAKTPAGKSRFGVAIGLGFLSGLMVGIGGLTGGGPTMAGLSILGLPAMQAAGTSTYVISVMALVGVISHLFTGSIAWSAGLTLMVGSVIGAVGTPIVLRKFKLVHLNQWLTPIIGLVIVYFGINIFFK